MNKATKRILDFHSGDEVIAEIVRLQKDGYVQLKNWNLTQACEHLTATMQGGMEGFGFRAPWILRRTIIKWMFAGILKKRRMGSAPTLDRLKPKSDGVENEAVIQQCIDTIQSAAAFEGPLEDYPFLDDLSVDDWRQFMWIHAAHHLGFLIPETKSR